MNLETTLTEIRRFWPGGQPFEFGHAHAVRHHALNAFEQDVLLDDENGFCLAPRAVAWLFSRPRTWAEPLDNT